MKAKKETGKSKGKKIEKTRAMAPPAIIPLYPFGLFILPLLIPLASPVERKKSVSDSVTVFSI